MIYEEKTIETIPVGPLGLIPLKSCSTLGAKVNDWLVEWRNARVSTNLLSRLQAIRETLTLLRLKPRVSAPVKAREPLSLPFVVTIFTSW